MTATEPLTAASTSALFGRALRGTTVGLLLIVSVIAFEAIAVATALPTVVRSLHGLAYYGWPFTAFLVSNVTGIVLGGELSDRIGPRLPVFTGLGVFVGGLVVAGTAPWMSVFVLGRFIQGLGSGLVVVAIFVVIADVYDDPLRAKVFGLLSAAWVLPSLIGPVIAGALAQHVTWRLVFLGIPPLVAVALVLIVPGMRRSRRPATDVEAARVPMRWPFALLAAGGVALLQYAGQRRDVLSLFLLVAGAALLIPAVRVLLPRGSVTLRRGLPAVIGLRGIGAGAFFAVDALVPLTLTVVHGYSATEAGIPLTLGAVGWASASWLQGRMPNARRDRLVALGMGFVASAALLMAAVSLPAAPGWLSYPAWVFGGFGMGWIMPAVSLLTIDLSPVAERGRNSAALQISDVLASAICIGIGGALVAAAEGGAFGLPVAVRAVDLSMAALAFLGALLAGQGPAPLTCLRRTVIERVAAGTPITGWYGPAAVSLVDAMVYLDHAATTPMRSEAVQAMTAALGQLGNPSSLHASGRRARRAVEESRERIAAAMGARPSEVVFTSGGTESDNLAVKGLYWARRDTDECRRVILASAIEHHAVIDSVEWLAEREGARVVWLEPDELGRISVDGFAQALDEHADAIALATVMWANNEVGTVQPIADLAALSRRYGVPFHTDAVQAVGQLAVDFAGCGAAALTLTGHKLGGPLGIGALLLGRDVACVPVLHGGGQERDVRSGTLDTPAIVAFATAVEAAVKAQVESAARLAALRDDLVEGVLGVVPEALYNGDPAADRRLPGNAHFSFPGCEGDALLMLLDARGIECSTGSACSAGVAQPSHVLVAMGAGPDRARGSLRFSLGHTSTEADVEALVEAIGPVVERARRAGDVSRQG